jgi:hypothetical protein
MGEFNDEIRNPPELRAAAHAHAKRLLVLSALAHRAETQLGTYSAAIAVGQDQRTAVH